MALYGYVRVSTQGQNNEKFHQSLIEAGVDPTNIWEETISGAKSWKRRKLGDLINSLQKGDKIVVPELSRLGRGAADVLNLRDALINKGITVQTLKEGYRIGAEMRPADKMVITVMAAVNEMERDFLSERTKEGLEYARSQGKQLGGYRGKVSPGRNHHPDKAAALKAVAHGGTISGTARAYGITRTTLYRWLRESDSCNKTT